MQTFRVEKGSQVEICKANSRQDWFAFVTTRTNTFDEPISRTRSSVVFRSGRWMLRVKPHQVQMHNGIRWIQLK